MSTIRLENLVKRFGPFTALKTMDLMIAGGAFMALSGPSGCGTSTTMNMIAGMEQPSEGRILFGGRDMTGVAMGQRGVGFVFQTYAIFAHMTVRQILACGLRATRRPAARGFAGFSVSRGRSACHCVRDGAVGQLFGCDASIRGPAVARFIARAAGNAGGGAGGAWLRSGAGDLLWGGRSCAAPAFGQDSGRSIR